MSVSLFKLAPAGKRDGVSCDANGAFIGTVALLKRTSANGVEMWSPRNANAISRDLSRGLGLPIDFSSKAAGIKAIANALNAGDIARAQLLTLFLRFPDPSSITKSNPSRDNVFRFVADLVSGDFVKGAFDPDKHPRWPARAPESQGGRFAPNAEIGTTLAVDDSSASSGSVVTSDPPGAIQVAANGQICREVAAAGCIAASGATAAEGAGVGCVVAGPGCPVGATVGGLVTALGACMIGGAEAYAACHSISSDEGFREALARCREECVRRYMDGSLHGPRGIKGSGAPGLMRRCLRDCLRLEGHDNF